MSISQSTWQETQCNLVQDFLDLFLSPVREVNVERDYPISSATRLFFETRFADIELPEKSCSDLRNTGITKMSNCLASPS